MTDRKPQFSPIALAPKDAVPAVELAPGLARAPRVAKLLDHAYGIAHRELAKLAERSHLHGLDDAEFKRFEKLLEKLPALMREERAGDAQRAELFKKMSKEDLARLTGMAAAYFSGEDGWNGTEEAVGEVVEGGQEPGGHERPDGPGLTTQGDGSDAGGA